MWSKKWYLKGNLSCDAHLLNQLLETDVADYINYFKMNEQTETVGLPEWTAQFSVWKTTRKTFLRPALLPVKTQKFTQFFRQVWHHTVKSLSLTERECITPFRLRGHWDRLLLHYITPPNFFCHEHLVFLSVLVRYLFISAWRNPVYFSTGLSIWSAILARVLC